MSQATDYFADVSKSDLMRVVVALATELYETRDRLSALEAALAAQGADLSALDAPVEPAVYDPERLAARDAYVRRVFAALKDPAGPGL